MPLQSREPESPRINIDTLGVYACELANESDSQSEVCLVSLLALYFSLWFCFALFPQVQRISQRRTGECQTWRNVLCADVARRCCTSRHEGERLGACLRCCSALCQQIPPGMGVPGAWEAAVAGQAPVGFDNRDRGKALCVFEVFLWEMRFIKVQRSETELPWK